MRVKLHDALDHAVAIRRVVKTLPWVRGVDLRHEPGPTGWHPVIRIAAGHRVNTEHVVRERLKLIGLEIPVKIEEEQ